MGFIDRLKKNVEEDELRIQRAKASVEDKYHQFIVIIEQNSLVSHNSLDIDNTLRELGCFVSNGKTYQRRRAPYMTVDGRIMMMRDEHREKNAKYFFSQEIDWEHNVLTVIWESELYGRTIGTAKIGFGGTGADATNPIENAQTSAIGRALAQAGYGLFGTGIASAEEVRSAMKEREQMEGAGAPEPVEIASPAQTVQPAAKPQAQAATQTAPKQAAQPAQAAPQEQVPTQPQAKQAPQLANAPQYNPEDVRRLIDLKQRFKITSNTDLDPYVAEFGKTIGIEQLTKHTQLHGPLLGRFCDYLEQRLKGQQGEAA